MNDPATTLEILQAALKHLISALDLLDQTDVPTQIGAHTDLAAQQLREWLENMLSSGAP